MKTGTLIDFSEIVNSNQPWMMSSVVSIMGAATLGILLFVNRFLDPPQQRGFTLITIFYVLSICLGGAGTLSGLIGLVDPYNRGRALAGLILSGGYWALFCFNIGWTNCFNVVVISELF